MIAVSATFLRAQAGSDPTASNPAVEAAVVFRNCIRDFFLMAASPGLRKGIDFQIAKTRFFDGQLFLAHFSASVFSTSLCITPRAFRVKLKLSPILRMKYPDSCGFVRPAFQGAVPPVPGHQYL